MVLRLNGFELVLASALTDSPFLSTRCFESRLLGYGWFAIFQSLLCLRITWDDCRYLHFNGSQLMRVYFFKTKNRELAEAQWSYLDTLHSSGFASMRCMVPGRKKPFVKCPTTNSCARCPYGRKPEDKQAPVISLDGLLDDGYEPAPAESVEHRVLKKIEYEEIRARMDAEDPRIALAFEGKELYGETVQEIADELGVSAPRVYQLIARAKEIGRSYREETK